MILKTKFKDLLVFKNKSFKDKRGYFKELIKENKIYIGDIAVCYEVINSRSKRKSFITEFDKVWVHSFLHLLGYNHIKNKDYFKMFKFEKRILRLI